MNEVLAGDRHLITFAEDAAKRLFYARNGDSSPTYEPTSIPEAEAAVRVLGELFDGLPGAISEALGAARESGDLISSDKFQCIAEIIQNADDLDASQVRLLLEPNALWLAHDGSPVRLRHVLGLATPWLSTKSNQANTTGRFGIGLMTLRSLSKTLEVHCHPYHVRLDGSTLSPSDPPTTPPGFDETGWTTLCVPLEQGAVIPSELIGWLKRWDDAALLFLRSIKMVTLLDPTGAPIRELAVSRQDARAVVPDGLNASRTVSRQRVEANDGRSWIVYSEEVSTPAGVLRARKATEATTPIAIALPQYRIEHGQIYAGLPVTRTRLPIFANAQFDPLTNRRDFTNNEWNKALVPLVAGLWSRAALDLFSRDPKAAWHAMPLPDDTESDSPSSFTAGLEEAIISKTGQSVASQLSFSVHGRGKVQLTELAVEAQPLENILTETETADLAGLPATLPFRVRDQAGRWRLVLDAWRSSGADFPEPVGVERALDLLGDETRTVDSTIDLVAAGLDAGLVQHLLSLPCVIASNGRQIVPPQEDSPEALAANSSPLAEQLGLVTLLHPAHFGEANAATTVLKWLRESGILLDKPDDRVVVRRLAAAGSAGHQIETPLTDDQVRSLRAAFEHFDAAGQQKLGPDVGRAISLQAFEFESSGGRVVRKSTIARPTEAYLPRAVDRDTDSFAVAADQSPGIAWLSSHYARILRSSAGRDGIGAQRFLRLLGAETAPRLRPHPDLEQRFSDPRRGLPARHISSTVSRGLALRAQGASYTLEDRDCPVLETVVRDISRLGRGKKKRRKRAAALLATLARAWGRQFSEFTEVDAAEDYYSWKEKGRIASYWLWEARDVAWLDDESGTPRLPSELRLRTFGNVAIYGEDSPDYLHPDLDQTNWREVLSALGVTGDPSRRELVTRLKELRDDTVNKSRWSPEEIKRETAVVYKAIAQSLESPAGGPDLSVVQLRRAFHYPNGLVFTDLGWLAPQSVLGGPHIFGNYKAFAPAIGDTETLWRALGLRKPSFEDCLDVVRAIARKRGAPDPDEEAILLETMRALESLSKSGVAPRDRAKLRRIPLWTSKGWVRDRPVYATDDPVLLVGLRDQIPLWDPGGELQQFRSLVDLLRVEEIGIDAAQVIEPGLATEHDESSELFRTAIQLLREDLTRNEPELAKNVRFSWDLIGKFSVYIHSTLAVGVAAGREGEVVRYECGVAAKVDSDRRVVFIQIPAELSRVDSGGRAIAALFHGDQRHLALAWLAACHRALSGREARLIQLAEERGRREVEQTESDIATQMAEIRAHIDAKHRPLGGSTPRRATTSSLPVSTPNRWGDPQIPPSLDSHRVLVDPESLRLVDPQGRVEKREVTPRRKSADKGALAEPKPGTDGPHGRTPIRHYTDLDKETVGLEILRKLLSSDDTEISDLRAQRGVGADAVDELQNFYELKVSGGTEPDQVTLTDAEVKRALTTPKFFLAVVSGVEGVDARPKVRLIVDPLKQLQPAERGSINLSGVRSSNSQTYDFVRGGSHSAKGAEELYVQTNKPYT